jgi:hypothetical protein
MMQKIALLGAFLVGGFATICSCVRTYSIAQFPHSTDWLYHAAPINYWSFMEINLGILCASGPALKAMWNHMFQPAEMLPSGNNIHEKVSTQASFYTV